MNQFPPILAARKLTERPLDLTGPVEFADIQAAAGEEKTLKTFSIKAYTGGAMLIAWWPYPVVIDLAGVKPAAKSIAVIKDHIPSLVVGHTTAVEITDNRITANGVVSGAGTVAREVASSSANGFPWQASVGVRTTKVDFISEGQSGECNGQKFDGPIYIARKSQLYEISFVTFGADDKTSARVAASAANQQEEFDMPFEKWLQAKGFTPGEISKEQEAAMRLIYDAEIEAAANKQTAIKPEPAKPVQAAANPDPAVDPVAEMRAQVAADAKRINAVNALCAKYSTEGNVDKLDEIQANAIAEGWTADATELALLRASHPKAPAVRSGANVASTPEILEAALCQAGGLDKSEDQFEAPTLEAAHKAFKGRIGLQELLLEAARMSGYAGNSYRRDERGVLRAAFSTVGLSGILGNTANKFLLAGFNGVEDSWRSIAAIRAVNDFKAITSYRLTGNMEYAEVGAGGELTHGTVDEESYTNQAKTYGRMFAITRQDIINDDLGALSALPQRIGRGAALKLNKVFWTAFMDNSTFFASGNINYASGASTALGVNALTAAELLFLNQTDPDGDPLGVDPAILLVPNALFVTATALMKSLEIRDTTASTKAPISNPHAGKFQVAKTSYLSSSSITGYSAAAWYLLADPKTLPVIEVAFLNGKQTPTVESADADFNVLGIQMRGYHDFGVAQQEYRAGVKMAGA